MTSPPSGRLEDERALCAVGDDEAVGDVMQLTAEAAALVHVTHHFPRRVAVRGVLYTQRYTPLSAPCRSHAGSVQTKLHTTFRAVSQSSV